MNARTYIFSFLFVHVWLTKSLIAQQQFFDFNDTRKPILSQSCFSIDASQVFSTFRFTAMLNEKNVVNNGTEVINYSQITSAAFGLGFDYVSDKGIILAGGVGLRKAGASMVYKKINYLWNLQYIDLKACVGYQYDRWRLKPYFVLSPYYAYLLNAKQSIGLNYYDIKSTGVLRNYDLGMFINPGLKATINPYISIYAEYTYILGLKNIETTAGQYLYNKGFAVKIGLAFSITNFKAAQDRIGKVPPFQQNTDSADPAYSSDNNDNSQYSPGNINSDKPVSDKTNSSNTDVTANTQTNTEISGSESKIDLPGTVGWANNKTTPGNKNTSPSADINHTVTDNESVTSTYQNDNTLAKTNQYPSGSNEASAAKTSVNAGTEKLKPIAVNQKQNDVNKIEFKIQLTSAKTLLQKDHPIIKKAKGKVQAERGKDGWIRYYLGSYETYEEARDELKYAKAKGIADGGFIVAFKNGKKITVAEAKELVK